MVMHERQMEREAKDQALIRLRIAMRSVPSRYTYSRKMIGEAVRLLEGEVSPLDVVQYHEGNR